MTSIDFTAWSDGGHQRKYRRVGVQRISLDTALRSQAITNHIDSVIAQLRDHHGPRGFSLGEWRSNNNGKQCLVANHALILDYRAASLDALQQACQARLPYEHLFILTENKARTTNTVSLVVPFSAPVSEAVYERVAAVIAKQLDAYGLIDGTLCATYIANLHATSLHAYVRGPLLDAETFKRSTAHQYQERDAAKYYREDRPAERVQHSVVISDGLFEFPASKQEIAAHQEQVILSKLR